ncbi:MAG: Trk system potassium transporter TrkA [Bacteroidales bacterium]
MNIIIAGDSEVSLHLADLLSGEKHDVTLISPSHELLKVIEAHSDLMTMVGDSTLVAVLKNANIQRADLLISAHLDGRLNLLTAILGKRLGAKKVIAKVHQPEYLTEDCRNHYKNLGIDYLVSPERIAAKEIVNLLKNTAATEIFDFSEGHLSIMLIKLEEGAPVIGQSLMEIADQYKKLKFRAVALHRKSRTQIPKGDDVFQEGDLAYVVTQPDGINQLLELGGKKQFDIKNIMIVGGGAVGSHAAASLEKRMNVKLFDLDPVRSDELSEVLTNTLVINGDARDITLLEDEGISAMDAFVAVTNNSETNILTCLLARKLGVKKTIALVENLDFIDISQTIGIDTIINKKLATASYILRFTMTAEVISTKCLTGIDAEVFEFLAKPGSPITKKPIRKLKFPDKAIIGGIIRNNQGLIATGDMQIQAYDKVVVFSLPQAFSLVDRMFKP